VKVISPTIVEVSKKIVSKPAAHLNKYDVFLADKNFKTPPGYVDQEKVIYGFNSFTKNQIFRYEKGVVRIFLPGYEKASRTYIAGSFNNWDPKKTAMQFVDSGWMIKMPLPAGKYLYKFIVDGRWMPDPNNRFQENDGLGNINSVFYCANYQFTLNGYKDAKKVYVAGTFNSWNRNELKMRKVASGWILPMYLKDGTYSYKFLVDDVWVNDPANVKQRPDVAGNKNSVITKGDEHIFRLKGYTNARQVILAGNFNKWNPTELLMEKTSTGWELPYSLSPGNYEYKFIVDGRWMIDFDNPYTTGSGSTTNSCLAYKPNHVFKLDGEYHAHEVIVTGSFNNWNKKGYRMVKQGDVWTFPIYLSKGKHLYKFIIDGKWILDPANKLWEQNEFSTGNSVLWVK
jgi:1,4-alpha-glucan branching enzyme